MTLLRWLIETLSRFFNGKRSVTQRIRAMFTIVRAYLLGRLSSQPKGPSYDYTRTRDVYARQNDSMDVVVTCSSLAPYQLSPSNTSLSANASAPDVSSDRTPRNLLPSSALGRRSRSHTPSAHHSRSSSPDVITSSVIEPSPIEEEPRMNGSQINLNDYRNLDLRRQYLPPRSSSPMGTASIRKSLHAPSRAPSPSLRAHSPSFRPSSIHSRAASPSLGVPSPTFTRSRSPVPSRRSRILASNTRAPSLKPASHYSASGDVVRRSELSDTFKNFYPTAPEWLERYERRVFVSENQEDHMIEPLQTKFKFVFDHDEWVAHIHPEGARYFYNKAKRIFTDADLCNDDIMTITTSFIDQMEDFIRAQGIAIPPTAELAFDIIRAEGDGDIYCAYYFVDHENRSIFWLDSYSCETFTVWSEVRGVTSNSHIGLIIEAQYWYHCQLFPICIPLTLQLVDELRDLVIATIGDLVTSVVSTSPYEIGDLNQILTLTNNMRKLVGSTHGVAPGSVTSLGRFMHSFARQRVFHFYGEPSARLERDRSVYGNLDMRRTLLITFLSPVLFFAPEVNLRALEKIWVDNILNQSVWAAFISKLTGEWQEFILYATVLLNANVAFLAIQSVDEASYTVTRSAAQISSYLSVITSIGSIIIGLLLVRQNRTKAKETSSDALMFLNKQRHEMLGLETLSIMYSLPYALLMWGMVAFLTAFTLMCLIASNLTVQLLVGCAWLAVACLVLWCITISWDAKDEHRWYMWVARFTVLLWAAFFEKLRITAPPIVRTLKKIRTPWRRASIDSTQTAV